MRLSVERAAPERAAGVAPAAARPTRNLAAWWALTLAVALGSAGAPAAAQESIASGIDAVFADLAVAGSPGCSVAVLKDGRTIHARGYGLASLEHDVPIRPDTVFDIASISKQFTAASIVLLDLEHRLSLDDSIAKHVPELAATGRGVTLRQMLHHTGGLRDYLSLLDLAGLEERGVSTPADALEILVRQEGVNFPPGTDYEYCNSGYFLMSEVVRRVTGKSLAVFAQERIFEPLGMRNTRFLEDQTLPVPRRATGYSAADGGGFHIDMSQYEQIGDGAVVTTVGDMALWDANFYSPIVGGPALLERLQTPGILLDGTVLDYGLGLSLDTYRGLRRVRHSGSWAGYRAEFARYPDERFSVICLCNLESAKPRTRAAQIAALVLGSRLAPETGKLPTTASPPTAGAPPGTGSIPTAGSVPVPDSLLGGFRNPRTGEVVTLRRDGATLRMDDWGDDAEVIVLGENRLSLPDWGEEAVIEPAGGGKPPRLRITGRGARPEFFERYERVTLTSARIREYAGRYFSDEIEASLTLDAGKDGLALRLPRRDDPLPLAPTVRDAFDGGEVILQFERNAAGRIVALRLSAEGARNLRYVRQR